MGDFDGHPFRGNQYTKAFIASRAEHEYAPDAQFTASDFALHSSMGMKHIGLKTQDWMDKVARVPLRPGEVPSQTTQEARDLIKIGVKAGMVRQVGTRSRYAGTTGRTGMAIAMKRTDALYKMVPDWTPPTRVGS